MNTPSRLKAAHAALALSIAAGSALLSSAYAAAPFGFMDDQPVRNDLIGALQGTVKFAQTHTIDPAHNAANEMPSLITDRDALVLFVPQAPIAESEMGQVKVTALRGSTVVGERLLAPPRLLPKGDRGDADERPGVAFSQRAWSAQLPWEWMKPGLSLRFTHQQQSGLLGEHALDFTGPAEVVVQNIRIGMLTDPVPASANWLESQQGLAALDYFQKIPVARLTIGQYLPVHLDRVVMPDGTTYTSASAGKGTVHTGDMREAIGKALIATGINLANYGIVDSGGPSQNQPAHFQQIVVHQNVGRYANGVIRHGYSGGNGMATLFDTTGNEFSHELGHAFGLSHYPGGGYWSSHHGTSGWGYDAFRNRFLSNLRWSVPTAHNFVEGVVTPPFQGLYRYRQDPMAGGSPDGTLSSLTHHTGYSMKRVQDALVASGQIDPDSPSGYSRWHEGTKSLVATKPGTRPAAFGVPVVTLVGFYDPQGQLPTTLYPPMYGNHGHTYNLPTPTPGSGCQLDVWSRTDEGASLKQTSIRLADSRHLAGVMNKFHVNIPASQSPQRVDLSCSVQGQQRQLATLAVEPPPQQLEAAIQVGKEAGYGVAALRLEAFRASITQRYSGTDEFEQRVSDVYGEINGWSEARTGRVGALYVYQNPYSGLREYFMLKQPRYGYYPTDGTSNTEWRYMGRAEDHVTWRPEPIKALATPGTSLSEKIQAYYKVKAIKQWRANDATARRGEVFEYHNPYTGAHEFFMALTAPYWYFPTDGRSNKDWLYLGNAESLQRVFYPPDASAFSELLAAWHQQDGIRVWGSPTNKGTVGDIYSYAQPGRVDYFRLKTHDYWYFPSNQTSNIYWDYLGTYR